MFLYYKLNTKGVCRFQEISGKFSDLIESGKLISGKMQKFRTSPMAASIQV